MTIKNFRASDFTKGGSDVKVVRSRRDNVRKTEPEPTSKPVVTENPEDVPAGTVPEIMTWVGEDPERAQKALDREVEDDKPRKGLVSQLQELVNSEDDEEPESPEDEESSDEEEEEN